MKQRFLLRVHAFSPCRAYRYTLWRQWDLFTHDYLMVIGLNPSTADEDRDDPTLRKVIKFAKREGYGSVCMTNLFAFRATQPAQMKQAADPVGADNDDHLTLIARQASGILAAWGTDGAHLNRAAKVIQLLPMLPEWRCLGTNENGSPRHPLYLPDATPLQPFMTSH